MKLFSGLLFCFLREEGESKDLINELPDCILSSIFSLLTLKDVVDATSMVSPRWRRLVLHPILTRLNLEFDIPNVFGISIDDDAIADKHRKQDFIRCVNKVLQLHHGNKVDSFKVKFYFNRKSTAILDEWIRFAITKGAEVLYLHFSRYSEAEKGNYYDFPCWLLSELRPSTLKNLSLTGCVLRLPPSFDRFSHLTTLYLYEVIVDNISLARLLSDCLLLESLTLDYCWGASELMVKVKLASLEILSGSLHMNLSVKPPYPAKISFGSILHFNLCARLTQFASFSGLETLHLQLEMLHHDELPRSLPTFRDLKKLEVDLLFSQKADLAGVLNLLKATPFLEQLVVSVLHVWGACFGDSFCEDEQEIRKFSGLKHNHLRKVKLQAFRSTPYEIEFAISILKNTTKLEIMEIDPFGEIYLGAGVWRKVMGICGLYASNSSWEEKDRALVQEKLKEVKTDARIIIL
ncbi:putative F-box/LRR-repeat protein [Prunus yedoensis var. nudiflora]|uniref:Putative F-box/LRR-repeat protein n=1 Tax=Prunus yedoensis var. nudiflora TaxID=2094558 RepID=A0A314USK2_PRUYE|nr:putative F-box/LRR-repeat protein [Prunus yedoensis var. nudiflora]